MKRTAAGPVVRDNKRHGRLLITAGIVLVAAGLVIVIGEKVRDSLGRLPGDIRIEGPREDSIFRS